MKHRWFLGLLVLVGLPSPSLAGSQPDDGIWRYSDSTRTVEIQDTIRGPKRQRLPDREAQILLASIEAGERMSFRNTEVRYIPFTVRGRVCLERFRVYLTGLGYPVESTGPDGEGIFGPRCATGSKNFGARKMKEAGPLTEALRIEAILSDGTILELRRVRGVP